MLSDVGGVSGGSGMVWRLDLDDNVSDIADECVFLNRRIGLSRKPTHIVTASSSWSSKLAKPRSERKTYSFWLLL